MRKREDTFRFKQSEHMWSGVCTRRGYESLLCYKKVDLNIEFNSKEDEGIQLRRKTSHLRGNQSSCRGCNRKRRKYPKRSEDDDSQPWERGVCRVSRGHLVSFSGGLIKTTKEQQRLHFEWIFLLFPFRTLSHCLLYSRDAQNPVKGSPFNWPLNFIHFLGPFTTCIGRTVAKTWLDKWSNLGYIRVHSFMKRKGRWMYRISLVHLSHSIHPASFPSVVTIQVGNVSSRFRFWMVGP